MDLSHLNLQPCHQHPPILGECAVYSILFSVSKPVCYLTDDDCVFFLSVPMIGSYINLMLYTLELVEAYIYYFDSPRSSRDPIFLKCCVAASLVSDTVGTIGICALSFVVSATQNSYLRLYF